MYGKVTSKGSAEECQWSSNRFPAECISNQNYDRAGCSLWTRWPGLLIYSGVGGLKHFDRDPPNSKVKQFLSQELEDLSICLGAHPTFDLLPFTLRGGSGGASQRGSWAAPPRIPPFQCCKFCPTLRISLSSLIPFCSPFPKNRSVYISSASFFKSEMKCLRTSPFFFFSL